MGRPKTQSEPIINHFSHPHPLHLTNPQPNQPSRTCSACNQTLEREPFYTCKAPPCTTTFFLHTSCATLPSSLSHPSHHHPLNLVLLPPYGNNGFSCDVCGEMGASKCWLYRCGLCGFDVHLSCAASKAPQAVAGGGGARSNVINGSENPIGNQLFGAGRDQFLQTLAAGGALSHPLLQQMMAGGGGAASHPLLQQMMGGAGGAVGNPLLQSVMGGGVGGGAAASHPLLQQMMAGGGGGGALSSQLLQQMMAGGGGGGALSSQLLQQMMAGGGGGGGLSNQLLQQAMGGGGDLLQGLLNGSSGGVGGVDFSSVLGGLMGGGLGGFGL